MSSISWSNRKRLNEKTLLDINPISQWLHSAEVQCFQGLLHTKHSVSLWLKLVTVTTWPLRENKVYSVLGLQWWHLLVLNQVMGKPTVYLTIWHGVVQRAAESGGKAIEDHALDATGMPKALMITGLNQKCPGLEILCMIACNLICI